MLINISDDYVISELANSNNISVILLILDKIKYHHPERFEKIVRQMEQDKPHTNGLNSAKFVTIGGHNVTLNKCHEYDYLTTEVADKIVKEGKKPNFTAVFHYECLPEEFKSAVNKKVEQILKKKRAIYLARKAREVAKAKKLLGIPVK